MTDPDNQKHEKAPRDTAVWYKDFVDYARDLIQCVDSEGRFVYVNQAWLSVLKFTAQEIAGITLWDIIHPDSREHCMAVFKKAVTGKAAYKVEATFITKDSNPVLVNGNVSVRFDENGRFVHTRGVFHQVITHEPQLRAFFEGSRDGLVTTDVTGRFLNANQAYCDMLGYSLEELKAMENFYVITPERWREWEREEIVNNRLLKDGFSRLYEKEYVRKDGAVFPVELQSFAVFDAGGDVQYLWGVARDITDRKRAEEKLREEKAFQAILLDLAAGFINVPPAEFDFAINDMLKKIGEFSGLDRVYLFMHDHLRRVTSNTHEWCRTGVTPERDTLQDIPFAFFSDMLKNWEKGEYVHISSVVRMPQKHAMRAILLEQDIQSLIMIPLMQDQVNTGFVGFDAVNELKSFSEQEIALLRVVAEIIANAFARKQAEETLREKSRQLRMLLDTVPSYIFAKDIDGRFLLVNKAVADVFGVDPEQVEGKTDLDYGASEEQMRAYNKIDRGVIESGESLMIPEELIMRKDGSLGWFQTVKIPYCHPGWNKPAILGVATEITDRKIYEAELKYLSYHDQLTGLYNRHFLEEEMNRLDTERQLPISIVMADLDGLKLVNDTIGHLAGDEMLKRVADILKSVCLKDDLLARYGGDEFVLYLPRTPVQKARKLSERIEKACRQELVHGLPLSLSTGVAVKAGAGQNLSDVLREAEDNMNRDKLTESRSGKSTIVSSLLQALAEKSFETETHTRNMQAAAKSIGEKLGLPHHELRRLSLLITLHDIGKINIPEELLTKKGSLSAAEWKIMKKHCETGCRIAKATGNCDHVAEDILAHHERWDGSGYPRGLKGDKIPLLARITAIVDAYEVMSNGRSYKKAMSRNEIVTELKRCAGSQFDPEMIELFLAVLDEGSGKSF